MAEPRDTAAPVYPKLRFGRLKQNENDVHHHHTFHLILSTRHLNPAEGQPVGALPVPHIDLHNHRFGSNRALQLNMERNKPKNTFVPSDTEFYSQPPPPSPPKS